MRHLFYFRVMQNQKVLQLIDEKLQQLEEAEKDNVWKTKISFGVHLEVYRQSPYFHAFIKKKKLVQRLLIFQTFALPILVLTLSFGFNSQPETGFWKTVGLILINAFFVGAIFIYGILRSLVRDTISTENEVKKMMLHDLRQKVAAMEEVSV